MKPKAKLRPYPLEDPCPCGSGLTYSGCCHSKSFKFELDARNQIVRSVPIPPLLIRQLKQQQKEFKDYFGRKPGKGDRVFFKQFDESSEDHYWETTIETALSVGVRPATVYAMKKTGLFPLLRNPPFSEAQSRKFSELIKLVSRAPLILASIVDRGLMRPIQPVNFFQLLFATQALHFLKRFRLALSLDYFDGEEGITRSIYEAFLRIRYLRYAPQKVEIFLALAGVGGGAYEYVTKNGRLDWSVIRDVKANKKINVNVSNYKMALSSGDENDVDVYRILFRRLSQSIHPNVEKIGQKFSVERGFALFSESNPFDGLLLAAFVLVLLFDEISSNELFAGNSKRDARFVVRKVIRAVNAIGNRSLQIFPHEFACLKKQNEVNCGRRRLGLYVFIRHHRLDLGVHAELPHGLPNQVRHDKCAERSSCGRSALRANTSQKLPNTLVSTASSLTER